MYKNYIFDLYGTLIDIRTDEWSENVWEEYARWLAGEGYTYSGTESPGKIVHAIYDREVKRLGAEPSPYAFPELDILPVFRTILAEGSMASLTGSGGTPTVSLTGSDGTPTASPTGSDGTPTASDEEAYRAGEQFRRISTSHLALYPNALRMLKALRAAGKKVYLLSNAQHVFTAQELTGTGLSEYFDDIFISSDEGVKKPDPEFFARLFAKHHLKKEESIMIGNDSVCDVGGALAFGIDAAYVRTAISPENDPAPVCCPDRIVRGNAATEWAKPAPSCRAVWEDGDIGHVEELLAVDTVIFDLDGTLLDTLEDLTASTNYALAKHGYPLRSRAEVRRFVGNGVRLLVERAVTSELRNGREIVKREGCELSDTEFEAVFADFKEHYALHCNDKTCAYAGTVELMRELKRRGIKLGICSNKVAGAVMELNRIYFDGLVDVAAGVDEGIPTKPDPTMAEDVLHRLGSRAERTLYVGDSQVDVATAANAGLRMVTVLWGFRDRDELSEAGADRFIEKPEELLNFIR